jgi:hypothetical protein
MDKQFTVIRFTQVRRGRISHAWVAAVSWGDGLKVKRVSFTADREKAARFSLTTALTIAGQYYSSNVTLERPDGTAMPDATAAVREAAALSRRQSAENQRAFAKELEPFAAELRTILTKTAARLESL